jgi:UDP-N-acetylmuramoyl-tripeptide--D-alanyl-D-alanine ligase
MEFLTIGEIIDAAKGELIHGNREHLVSNITIDSRIVKKGDCFIAIVGKALNGHNYGYEAIEKGATTVIGHQLFEVLSPANNLIKVKNTTRALGDIALYYRRKFTPRVVAITGSNGKTTSKEMIAHILQNKLKLVKAPNSYNNDIGVPVTVLKINNRTKALILEMEMNELGGIRRLCDIALPHIGVLTNIGDTHLEFLKDRAGVAQEKSELLESIALFGSAVLNADDELVMQIGNKYKYKEKITYGFNNHADIIASDIKNLNEQGIEFKLCGKYHVRLKIPGIYNIYNALAAVSVARIFDIDFDEIVGVLKSFKLTSMRMEKLNISGIEIINDAYNANPQSMLASLQTFAQFPSQGRKVLILGDMLELGKKSKELHKEVGAGLPDEINVLITVGKQAKFIAKQAKYTKKIEQIMSFTDSEDAAKKLVDFIQINDKILIKGSRAMQMEKIINKLKEYYDRKTKTS